MLTSAQLTGRDDNHIIASHNSRLHPQTAVAFTELQRAAQAAGLAIEIASGFRDFQRQLMIWNRKFNGDAPLYNGYGDLLEPENLSIGEKVEAILTWSALPGASRHHFGTELDVFDPRPFTDSDTRLQLIASEYAEDGPCYAIATWLQRHAHEFGFFFPYARYQGGVAAEPWHLSFRAVAEPCRAALTEDVLRDCLSQTDALAGQAYILECLTDIKRMYVDNICTDNGWSDVWCTYSSP